MAEENIVCIGCPLGCRTTLRIAHHGNVVKITGYKCKEGRQYVLEEHSNPVRILTATIRTEKSSRPLLPVRTSRPILKSKLKEATLALARLKAKPPVKMGEVILPNLLNSGIDVVATDDLFPGPTLSLETVSQYEKKDSSEKGERRSGGKDLDLPARSRFGEGRA